MSAQRQAPDEGRPAGFWRRLTSSRLLRRILSVILLLSSVALAALGFWLYQLDGNIKTRFAEKRFAPPVEFYSAPETVRAGSQFPPGYFEALFKRKNYRSRDFGQPLQAGDYSLWSGEQCRSSVASNAPSAQPSLEPSSADATAAPPPAGPEIQKCVAFKNAGPSGEAGDEAQIIAIASDGKIVSVHKGAQGSFTEAAMIEPELFAQYYDDTPILRNVVRLGDVPIACLDSLLAIEDPKFLEHTGVSFRGLARAFVSNLRGSGMQGGSTITQQLVKNYFLTQERTLKRKLTEIPMAMLVEMHASKDEILETYINLIYMGSNGPFQVRGFAAASQHYIGKPLSELNLPECALLSAVLNNPGLFNPFRKPENALKRRARVLDKMVEHGKIDQATADQAKAVALPTKPERALTDPAPYFVQAVRRDLKARGIDESEGLRVYTTLNLRAQESAHQAVRAGLDRLEKTQPQIAKLKASGKSLEAILIASDPVTGAVEAMVGGRGFLATQFNRATDSRRQVGSVMKSFVYLAAYEGQTPEGQPYTPLTLIKDTATTHKYEGQTWTPRNYDGKFQGDVPMFWALKESLNAATVNLGLSVGLNNIIDVAQRLGIVSPIKPLPSLTLGAFELSPMEVLQSYSALARLGNKVPLSLLWRVDGLDGEPVYEFEPTPEVVVPSDAVSLLVGTLKQTIQTGSARGARLSGFTHPSAGKTGTTNDKKDAWFAGFTPYHTAVVWVGYDDNTSHNLAGGSGAVPIWTQYMKAYATSFPPADFPWPETVERVVLSPEQQLGFGVPVKGNAEAEPLELIFRKGQSPVPPDPSAPPAANPFKPPGI